MTPKCHGWCGPQSRGLVTLDGLVSLCTELTCILARSHVSSHCAVNFPVVKRWELPQMMSCPAECWSGAITVCGNERLVDLSTMSQALGQRGELLRSTGPLIEESWKVQGYPHNSVCSYTRVTGLVNVTYLYGHLIWHALIFEVWVGWCFVTCWIVFPRSYLQLELPTVVFWCHWVISQSYLKNM